MHVPTRGRILGRSDRTRGETCLIFEKLVAHRALRVHHSGFESAVFPRFPSAASMTASSFTSVYEESCLGF